MKDHLDRKRPPWRNRPKQLLTYNMPVWKLLTGQVKEEIYSSLISQGLLSEEGRYATRGSILYIHQHTLKESKTKRKTVAMVWIDYKKVHDIVPQSWIIDCFKKYTISDEVIKLIVETMKNWRVELTVEGKNLAEVKIQRGIFQGDVLSSLLFVIAMWPFNHKLRKCTGGY